MLIEKPGPSGIKILASLERGEEEEEMEKKKRRRESESSDGHCGEKGNE